MFMPQKTNSNPTCRNPTLGLASASGSMIVLLQWDREHRRASTLPNHPLHLSSENKMAGSVLTHNMHLLRQSGTPLELLLFQTLPTNRQTLSPPNSKGLNPHLHRNLSSLLGPSDPSLRSSSPTILHLRSTWLLCPAPTTPVQQHRLAVETSISTSTLLSLSHQMPGRSTRLWHHPRQRVPPSAPLIHCQKHLSNMPTI